MTAATETQPMAPTLIRDADRRDDRRDGDGDVRHGGLGELPAPWLLHPVHLRGCPIRNPVLMNRETRVRDRPFKWGPPQPCGGPAPRLSTGPTR